MCNSASITSLPIIFLLFLHFSIPPSAGAATCNKNDRDALLAIKSQLGNPSELGTWRPATDCCGWTNVYCTEAGRVYNVYLSALRVSAALPTAFGNLPELRTIQLDEMPGLSGTIPRSFAKLTKLEHLQITGTSVSGAIPDFLAQTNLSSLTLANNKFSGPIPRSLARLSNLRYIDLSGNRLSDTIPPGLLHGKSQFLILANNDLSGLIPREYGNGDIDTIDLSHNGLLDTALFLFGAAKPTTKIDLSWNGLAFDLTPAVMPRHLTYLDLSHNGLSGMVPKSLADVKLRHLNLSDNGLCGPIPTGPYMTYGADSYLGNKCLCGKPLPPC